MKTIGIRTQKRAKTNLVSSGRYKFLSTKKVLYSNSPIIISKTLSKASSTLPNGSWNKEEICPNHWSEARIRHSPPLLISDGLPGNQKSGYNFRSENYCNYHSDLALGKFYVWHGSTSLYPHTTGTDRVCINCTKVWSLFVINSLNLHICVMYLVFIKK